jgi:hypothetical protein
MKLTTNDLIETQMNGLSTSSYSFFPFFCMSDK